MKHLILFFAFTMASILSYANDAYIKTMKKNQKSLQEANTIDELIEVANSYERIASIQTEEWLPLYYAAYSNIRISNLKEKPADKDAYLDKAQVHLDKALKLKKEDSELVALQGFILMMKVSVDPANRGQALAGKVMAAFEKAVQLNPSNPRAQFLLGNWSFGTAQFFKASTEESCEMIKKSINLFEMEQPGELGPSWGKEMAKGMLSYCQ